MVKDTGVPAGYKQTEVGVIPVEWEVKTFGDLADKRVKWSITGGPFGSNLKASEYTSDGVRIVQLQNIGDGVFNDEYKIYTSEEKANELLSCNIYPNEIILSKMGDPVARACFIPNTGKRFLMSSDGIRLVVDENCFAKKFVHDYINSEYFRKRAFEASIGSTRLRIGLQDLKTLLVIAPPLPEQTAIASALTDVDALITALEQLITKKRNIKQGAMQQLLTGKKRLPGFSGGWEVKKLGQITEIKTGKKNNEDKVTEGKYPFFVRSQQVERIDTYSFDGEAILMPGEGNIGSIFHYINGKFDYHQRVYKISNFSKDCCGKYIYYCMFQNFNHHAMKNSVKATVDSLRLPTFQEFEFYSPSLPEQQAIAQILSDMDTEIEAMEQKRDKYRALKQGMMQELLTGKTRLLCQQ